MFHFENHADGWLASERCPNNSFALPLFVFKLNIRKKDNLVPTCCLKFLNHKTICVSVSAKDKRDTCYTPCYLVMASFRTDWHSHVHHSFVGLAIMSCTHKQCLLQYADS